MALPQSSSWHGMKNWQLLVVFVGFLRDRRGICQILDTSKIRIKFYTRKRCNIFGKKIGFTHLFHFFSFFTLKFKLTPVILWKPETNSASATWLERSQAGAGGRDVDSRDYKWQKKLKKLEEGTLRADASLFVNLFIVKSHFLGTLSSPPTSSSKWVKELSCSPK